MSVFWVETPCGLIGAYQHFGGTYCLHLQAWCNMYLRNVCICLQILATLRVGPTSTCSRSKDIKSRMTGEWYHTNLSGYEAQYISLPDMTRGSKAAQLYSRLLTAASNKVDHDYFVSSCKLTVINNSNHLTSFEICFVFLCSFISVVAVCNLWALLELLSD
jgi:hypothetical protein